MTPTPSRHRVLLVDDHVDLLELLADLVRDEGYHVDTAANGRDALTHLQANVRELPCVILLDVMMPIMDGHAFRAHQVTDPTLARVPVVVVSAHSDAAAVARSMGVTDYLRKPVELDDLLAVIARHCPRGPACPDPSL